MANNVKKIQKLKLVKVALFIPVISRQEEITIVSDMIDFIKSKGYETKEGTLFGTWMITTQKKV